MPYCDWNENHTLLPYLAVSVWVEVIGDDHILRFWSGNICVTYRKVQFSCYNNFLAIHVSVNLCYINCMLNKVSNINYSRDARDIRPEPDSEIKSGCCQSSFKVWLCIFQHFVAIVWLEDQKMKDQLWFHRDLKIKIRCIPTWQYMQFRITVYLVVSRKPF